jgi:hypothetical protein
LAHSDADVDATLRAVSGALEVVEE